MDALNQERKKMYILVLITLAGNPVFQEFKTLNSCLYTLSQITPQVGSGFCVNSAQSIFPGMIKGGVR